MAKKTTLRVTFFDILQYLLVCIASGFLTNYIAKFVSQGVGGIIINSFPNMPKWAFYTVGFGLLIPVFAVVPYILLSLFFRYIVKEHYVRCDVPHFWIKNMVTLIIPGELVRFFVCLPNCGIHGKASAASTIMFEFWLDYSGRFKNVRQLGKFEFLDYFMYIICYLVIFFLYFGILMLAYKRAWNKIKEEQED